MGLDFHLTDNSAAVIAAKNAAVMRAMEAVGIHLKGEAADELENSPRRVDTGRLTRDDQREASAALSGLFPVQS